MLPLFSRLLLHTLACVAFPFLLQLGFDLYRAHVGPPVARGVGVGLATMLVFYTFVFFNLLMVAIPRAAVRYGLALLLVLVVLVYFNPLHPIRALGFAALCAGLCLLAIVLTPWGTRLLRLLCRWGGRLA
ncbi:hypothetical protein [Pseudomonas entomophila]|uniref:Uncharacterized protein n=1 Tax=Pseudomonas entomophila TaxID=312306 RepID=A0ABY9QKF8_9PSED|nr:hypothetical protein [Pseudomonas entomophila]WMW04525.1 hypothetical protein RAH46_19590 [Pseudomonas entomophila]